MERDCDYFEESVLKSGKKGKINDEVGGGRAGSKETTPL